MAGSGRLTLRNRRFLRKFQPHQPYGRKEVHTDQAFLIPNATRPSPSPSNVPPSIVLTPSEETAKGPAQQCPTNEVQQPDISNPLPELSHPDLQQSMMTTPDLATPTVEDPPRRSARLRQPRKIYEPETGKYIVKD